VGAGQFGGQVQYGYDLVGHITTLLYPGGVNRVTRTYDDSRSTELSLKRVFQWMALAVGVMFLLLFMILFVHNATLAWPLTAVQFLVYIGLPALEIAVVLVTFRLSRATGKVLVSTATVIWIAITVNVTLAFLRVFGF
jgi:hypothetical protein